MMACRWAEGTARYGQVDQRLAGTQAKIGELQLLPLREAALLYRPFEISCRQAGRN